MSILAYQVHPRSSIVAAELELGILRASVHKKKHKMHAFSATVTGLRLGIETK